MGLRIRSIARYLPETVIDSATLDKNAGIRPGWIEKNTGVRNRRWASGKETVCGMAAKALTAAMLKAHVVHTDLDLLIYAGSCHDYPVPHNSVIIKSMISDDSAPFNCMDIDTTCLSFLQAFDIASLYLNSGRCRRIAIVSSEMPSIAVQPSDPKVYGLFGDAAVAIIIESATSDASEILYTQFTNYPSAAYWAMVPVGGAHDRGCGHPANHPGYTFKMDGRKLIKLGCAHLKNFINEMQTATDINIRDIDFVAAHQASKMATEYLIKETGISRDRFVDTLMDYGNCVSASVPLGLEYIINTFNLLKGQTILMIGSGAGFTLGAILLKF